MIRDAMCWRDPNGLRHLKSIDQSGGQTLRLAILDMLLAERVQNIFSIIQHD